MAIQAPEPESEAAELMERACDGDVEAFEKIVNLYRCRVISYCWRMVGAMAEDAAQDVFIKLYLALDRFDPSKPVRPFLFRIAHNHCVDILKKKRIRAISFLQRNEQKCEIQPRDDRPDPEESTLNAELRQAIQGALAKVPVGYRSPLVMWHVEGISYAEISQILDLPLGTVKARIHRGRKLLQQKMAKFVCMNGEE